MRHIVYFIGVLFVVGCAAPQQIPVANTPREDPLELKARWNAIAMQHPELLTANWIDLGHIVKSDCPEAGELFEYLYEITVKEQYRRGRLYLEVVDEQGNRLRRVKTRVRGIWGGAFRLEPNVSSSEVVLDGEIKLPWMPPSFCIEIDLYKNGYRDVHIDFTKWDLDDRSTMYRDMMDSLCRGYIYPPRDPSGPIRVVMPTLAEWSPPLPDTVGGTIGLSPDLKKWPVKIIGNEPILSSTDNPKIILAPVRGTYVITDRDNKVVEIHQADKGSLIGFGRVKMMSFSPKPIEYVNRGTGSSLYNYKNDAMPYTLRLYSEAKPIPPPPEPPAPPPSPKPAKGAVVADD